jgi:hypothetical protein
VKSSLQAFLKRRNDVTLGIILIGLGLFSGWGIALFFLFVRDTLPFSMLIASAGFVFIGFMLIFSDGIEKSLQLDDEIQKFPVLIQDDLEDLKRRRITTPHAMVVITFLSLIGQLAGVFLYRKWQAQWAGSLNVVLVAVLAGFAIGFVGLTTKWFQDRRQRFSWWVFLLPLGFFALSAYLGIYYVEPQIKSVGDFPINRSANYQYATPDARINQIDGRGAFDIMDGTLELDCDDEGCLVLILVVIGIACVAASAFIPHFWVVATTILWVLMLLIATRELLYVGNIPQAD